MSGPMWLASLLLLLMLILPWSSVGAPTGSQPKCACPREKDECKCHLKGLETLPKYIINSCSPSWKKLDFSVNRINSLNPPGHFADGGCGNVEELSLFLNSINGTLETNTFRGLTNLRRLNLSRNSIDTLKGRPFDTCTELRSLDLSLNRIRVLSRTTFDGLSELRLLQLFGNYIGFIAARSFAKLGKLKRLILTQNNMTAMRADSFLGLSSLEELDLMRNPLKEVQLGLFNSTPNLRRLSFGLCGKLGSLTTLKGRLFTKLNRLTHFNLTDCYVRVIDVDAFVGLTAVKRLSLRKNLLSMVRREVWRPLKVLNYLDLSNNGLSCLYDSNFAFLKNLKELDLSNNHITYLSESAFIGLENLKTLNLNNNPLRFVQVDAFCHLNQLSFLHLVDVVVDNVINSDDNNSSLNGSVAALPSSVVVKLSSSEKPLRGYGIGCKAKRDNKIATKSPSASPECPKYKYMGCNSMGCPAKPSNRQYLLIIIGVCVSFLLTAMAVILSYRAWSKRKRTACEKAEQAALEEEKQEMMEKPAAGTAPGAQANGGNATTELLAAGQSAENGVVLHHHGVSSAKGQQENGAKEEENTMTHLAVV